MMTMSKPTVTCDDLETWRQTRLATVSSLRQLAKYVDNVSQFSSILVTFREAVFSQGATLLAGAVTVTAGVVLPFVVAGAGISMASHLATWLGGGGAALGVCLGCVGGALTLAGGGLVVPVVVAGVSMQLGAGLLRLLGLSDSAVLGGLLSLAGRIVVIVSVSTGLVIFLGGLGLYLAIPALNREIVTSRHVTAAVGEISRDAECSRNILSQLGAGLPSGGGEPAEHYQRLSALLLFSDKIEEVNLANLAEHITLFIRNQMNSSLQIQIIANDLEENIEVAMELMLQLQHVTVNSSL